MLAPGGVSDFHIDVFRGLNVSGPCIHTSINGCVWNSWPPRMSVAALEWVTNWCFFKASFSEHLAVHAAAAELPSGLGAIVFPGSSGAGKSTLAATLMLEGWRLLSDEVALYDMSQKCLFGLGRPTILKGKSIDLIQKQYPDTARFGPVMRMKDPPVPITHLCPTEETAEISGADFSPAAFIFPQRKVGASPSLSRVSPEVVFSAISQFGLNFRERGKAGFVAACHLARECPGYDLVYENAGDAESLLRKMDASGAFVATSNTEDLVVIPSTQAASASSPLSDAVAGQSCVSVGDQVQGEFSANSIHGGYSESVSVTWHTVKALAEGLRDPRGFANVGMSEWDRLLLLGEHLQILGPLGVGLERASLLDVLPTRVRSRFLQQGQQAALAKKNVEFEILHLRHVAERANVQPVLLKGAAYLACGARCGWGRVTRDVDILVAENEIDGLVSEMCKAGYSRDAELSDRHVAYYKKWLHEVPAMKHSYRRFEVDLHFRLLPKCDPQSFDCGAFIQRSVSYGDESIFRVLDRIDQAIHSIINLGRTGEFQRGFRDTWDLCCLIEGDALSPNVEGCFDWDEFAKRVLGLRLGRIAACVLCLAVELHSVSVPDSLIKEISGATRERVSKSRLYRTMKKAALPDERNLFPGSRQFALWAMEHYPLPKAKTWLDPLTWTKRISFLRDA